MVYVLVIRVGIWVAPQVFISPVNVMADGTRGLPEIVRVALSAAVIASLIALIIWAWSRFSRSH